MTAMSSTRDTLPTGPWTVEDLDAFPEGTGVRYELIDGALLVSAESSLQHQRVSRLLMRLLEDAAPSDLEVFQPIDVRLSPWRQVAPDITVVRRRDAQGPRLAGVPVLVVEVQSPSTRTVDLTLKRQALEEAGVPSYWLVEPDSLVVTVFELSAGRYEVVRLEGTERAELTQPFALSLYGSASWPSRTKRAAWSSATCAMSSTSRRATCPSTSACSTRPA
jgi:Uma2 family endonuclease